MCSTSPTFSDPHTHTPVHSTTGMLGNGPEQKQQKHQPKNITPNVLQKENERERARKKAINQFINQSNQSISTGSRFAPPHTDTRPYNAAPPLTAISHMPTSTHHFHRSRKVCIISMRSRQFSDDLLHSYIVGFVLVLASFVHLPPCPSSPKHSNRILIVNAYFVMRFIRIWFRPF